MAKGVKKIKWSGVGIVKSDLSTPNEKVVIAPNQQVLFEVEKWFEATPEADKKKNITWIFQERKTRTIVLQKTLPYNNRYGVKIPKNLCGPFEYYLEASLSSERNLINQTGLVVRGNCTPKIISSKWSTTNDGTDVRKTHFFKYGETLYLNLKTEGLNGYLNLCVDIFRHLDFKTDPILHRYTSVDVIDGEINLEINNTHAWFGKLNPVKETEEFYVKVFHPANKIYITDSDNDTEHARFLRINRKIISKEIKPSTNQSPLKTGKPDINAERYESCKFDTIKITDEDESIIVFEGGKSKLETSNPLEKIKASVWFDFDKDTIEPKSKQLLHNILQFLVEHQFSSMKLDGYACVIGKQNYNDKLSKRRSDAVKDFFINNGLARNRITSIGHGEVNATDDKQGRDNIKYKDEFDYKNNRRVDILFDYFGHTGQVVYETIAPSIDKDITIEVIGHETKKCFRSTDLHKKGIKVNSIQYTGFKEVKNASSITIPIKSDLSAFNIAPLQYIWPKFNILKGNDSATLYNANIHSCRWFSDNNSANLLIKVYPDIKWDLKFEYACKNPILYRDTWVKMRQARVSDAVNKAQAADIDGYDGDLETQFKIALSASWNKDSEHFDLSKEWEGKIAAFIKMFLFVKKMVNLLIGNKGGNSALKNLPGGTKNKCSAIAALIGRSPVMIEVLSPSVSTQVSWSLLNMVTTAKGMKRPPELGTKLELELKLSPLIGGKGTIDVVAVAEKIPAIGQAITAIEVALGVLGVQLTFAISLVGEVGLTAKTSGFYTSSYKMEYDNYEVQLENKFGIEVVLKISGEWEVKSFILWGDSVPITAEASAKAESYFTTKGSFGADQIGRFFNASVSFEGIYLTVEVKGSVGKMQNSRNHKITLVPKPKDPILGGNYYF
ncbi:OmpA family protein [Flavobacterium sp.]|uniref:OmpA family protein n=1 Tax=Flavobacterium sp. TaxID=239 RepID=UPI002D1E18CE|nr:OmpA family protein [Flavobacterium sp.]HSD07018.1 OmpA family protein [Flavobacterium sp.]